MLELIFAGYNIGALATFLFCWIRVFPTAYKEVRNIAKETDNKKLYKQHMINNPILWLGSFIAVYVSWWALIPMVTFLREYFIYKLVEAITE